jgi:hypothetical protein
VRVHATHDREHGCHDSFTLYICCTRSPWVIIILYSQIPIVGMEYTYTLLRCALRNHYKASQWFHLARYIPTEVSPPMWASHPTRIPLLCLMGFSHRSITHTFPRFSHRSSMNRSLDLGMITNPWLPASHWTKLWTIGITPNTVPNLSPQIHNLQSSNQFSNKPTGDSNKVTGQVLNPNQLLWG